VPRLASLPRERHGEPAKLVRDVILDRNTRRCGQTYLGSDTRRSFAHTTQGDMRAFQDRSLIPDKVRNVDRRHSLLLKKEDGPRVFLAEHGKQAPCPIYIGIGVLAYA
jgi:hypothetical protein